MLSKKKEYKDMTMDNKKYRDKFYEMMKEDNKRRGNKGESQTRAWDSNYAILEHLLKYESCIKRLVDTTELIKTKPYLKAKDGTDFKAMINNHDLWNKWKELMKKMKSMRCNLKVSQGHWFNLADVFHQYVVLANVYPEQKEEVFKRWNLICDAMHSAVYYADPRYVNEAMDDENEEQPFIDTAHEYYKVFLCKIYIRIFAHYKIYINIKQYIFSKYFHVIIGKIMVMIYGQVLEIKWVYLRILIIQKKMIMLLHHINFG